MERAGTLDDSEGWYHVVMGTLEVVNEQHMAEPIRWCKLHTSDGKFDYGIKWGHAEFRFQQLEDAMMFKLAWARN